MNNKKKRAKIQKRFVLPTVIIGLINFQPLNADVKWKSLNKNKNTKNSIAVEKEKNYNSQENYKHKQIWIKELDSNNYERKGINWIPYEIDPNETDLFLDSKINKTSDQKFKLIKEEEYKRQVNFTPLSLGASVPNSYTLEKGDLRITFSQISPINSSYYGGGTGNQNYFGGIDYGMTNNLTLGIFYAHSDDPLHNRINSLGKQPANRWISTGSYFKLKSFSNKVLNISLHGSIENWNVKSGGCNLYRCDSISNNIFNSSDNPVENDNLIWSISLPMNWKLSNNTEFVVSPRYISLPKNQGNNEGSGAFYGANFGIGTGVIYKPFARLGLFNSAFFPIGSGNNSFDSSLNYNRKVIFNSGVNYSLDSNVAFEASVSNGFGETPSTGILTLPSANEALYKLKFIYRPTNLAIGDVKTLKKEKKPFNGLSVSNAHILEQGDKRMNINFNDKGTWFSRIEWGISEFSNIDITTSSIGQVDNQRINAFKSNVYWVRSHFHEPGELFIIGGGRLMLISQKENNVMSSSLRLSAGRLKGVGWMFSEISNTLELSESLSFNLNPKIALSGTAKPIALGTSLHWEIMPGVSLIPETNIAVKDSSTNWTFAIRFTPSDNKFIDLYTTNSLGFVDTSQLLKADEQSFGINIGTVF